MAIIPLSYRRSPVFQKDLGRLLSLSPEQVEVVSRFVAEQAEEAERQAYSASAGIDEADLDAAFSVLTYLAHRVAATGSETLESELRDTVRRGELSTSEGAIAAVVQMAGPTSHATRAVAAATALGVYGRFYEMSFRPAVVLAPDDEELAGIAAMLCEFHYHDSDGEQHDISFALTAEEADELEEKLRVAIDRLNRLRGAGALPITNALGSAGSDE